MNIDGIDDVLLLFPIKIDLMLINIINQLDLINLMGVSSRKCLCSHRSIHRIHKMYLFENRHAIK